MPYARKTSTFILKIWTEEADASGASWRGYIDDVARKRRMYFRNLGSLCEFLIEQRALSAATDREGE